MSVAKPVLSGNQGIQSRNSADRDSNRLVSSPLENITSAPKLALRSFYRDSSAEAQSTTAARTTTPKPTQRTIATALEPASPIVTSHSPSNLVLTATGPGSPQVPEPSQEPSPEPSQASSGDGPRAPSRALKTQPHPQQPNRPSAWQDTRRPSAATGSDLRTSPEPVAR